MCTQLTEEPKRFSNVYRAPKGTQWISLVRLKKNTIAFEKYSKTKDGRVHVGTFSSQTSAAIARTVLLYLLAREDVSYKIDYENSKNQLEEWDDPFVDKSFVSDLDQATFPEVLSLFRDKGKSTQHLTSLASTRIAQKILKLHSRCSVPSRNVPNTAITPLQRETRKRKRSEKSHLQKLCQQLEEVVGGWITTQTNLLVPPPSMDLEDHSHSKSCSTQNLMHLYYPSGALPKLSVLSIAAQKSLKHHTGILMPIVNELCSLTDVNKVQRNQVVHPGPSSLRSVRKYIKNLTVRDDSTSNLSNPKSNPKSNPVSTSTDQLSCMHMTMERSGSAVEDINYYVYGSSSLRDIAVVEGCSRWFDLENGYGQSSPGICYTRDQLIQDDDSQKGTDESRLMQNKVNDDDEESTMIALRWAQAHVSVLELALGSKHDPDVQNQLGDIHFAARCIHWNEQIKLAVAYDMKEWLLQVFGQDYLSKISDNLETGMFSSDVFGPHTPPPDIYQPTTDFNRFTQLDEATAKLSWLYWGPSIVAASSRPSSGCYVCAVSEEELETDEYYCTVLSCSVRQS